MIFYPGTHVLSHAKHLTRCFISVNRLRNGENMRIKDFQVNNWILDSGAFTEISTYGYYRTSVSNYAKEITRWSKCGTLELAVSQDYMCEPFILKKTGLSIKEHQHMTIDRYDQLVNLTPVCIMPVLQGYEPMDYVVHAEMYGNRLNTGMRVGVGSVCKRNSNPKAIISVFEIIKKYFPSLRLHGFGLKITALKDAYIESMLYSADSMSWSFHARKNGLDGNSLSECINFNSRIQTESGKIGRQLILV